jgi:hypothetical protein
MNATVIGNRVIIVCFCLSAAFPDPPGTRRQAEAHIMRVRLIVLI